MSARKGPEIARLREEYEGGATSTELAAKYGCTHAAITRRLARAGVTLRPARRRAMYDKPETLAAIVSAYQGGVPMSEIAPTFGVSHSTVQRALKQSGVKLRPFGLRKRTVTVPTDPAALGYLCGLFDGEGNLQFRDKHAGRSIGCKMAIYNTDPGVMRWLMRTVGGKVLFDTARTKRHGWLPIGTWNVYRAQDVAALLAAMLPFLIVKKRQAENALRLFRHRFEIHDSPPTTTQSRRGPAIRRDDDSKEPSHCAAASPR